MRHALIDEAVADVPAHGLRTWRGAGDFGFLDLAVAGIGEQVERILGEIDSSSSTDVKRRLFAGFEKENTQGKFLEVEELFAGWREEAKAKTFGPEQVESVLRSAKPRTTFSEWLGSLNPWRHDPEPSQDQDKERTHSR